MSKCLMLHVNDLFFMLQVLLVTAMCLLCRSIGLSALVSWLCLQSILANLLVLKMVTILGLDVTVADAFMIGSLFCLNLIREHHGRMACQKAILASMLCLLVTILLLQLHLAFIPAPSDQMSQQYQLLFGHVLPIMFVSGCVFTVIQVLDYFLFGYLKLTMGSTQLSWRVFFSLATTQILDTALFTYWALGGWIESFWSVFLWSYALKVLITVVLSLSSGFRFSLGTILTKYSRYVQI